MMSTLKLVTSKTENSMAQCTEVFKYLHKKVGMSESTFKEYVRIDPNGEIKMNKLDNHKIVAIISAPLALVIARDRNREKIADIVIATLPSA